MLTIFSCPKPFRGHFGMIQRNAIRSWTLLTPTPDVILIGDEEGTSEVARDLKVRHLPRVGRNEFGTPLVSSIFEEAEKSATQEMMCYLNGDILLLSDFVPAVKNVLREMPCSLMVGRRWNLDVNEPLDFGDDWETNIIAQVARRGKLYPHFAIDYFVFPKGVWGEIAPLAIGRPAWDNWVIYRAHALGIPVVDLTERTKVVHQNHDYSHHPEGWTGAMKGDESRRNIELVGEAAHVYSLLDADYRLTSKGLKRRRPPLHKPFYLYRHLVVLSVSHPSLKPLVRFIKKLGDRFLSGP